MSDFDDTADSERPAVEPPRQIGELESIENLLGDEGPRERDDHRRGGRRRHR
jgi:hypothetical protein